MTRSEKTQKVIDKLSKLYPKPEGTPKTMTELGHSNPLELLIATILSAQCTDKRVNMTTPALFKRCKKVKDYAGADIKDMEKLLASINFFRNKSKSVINCAKMIESDFNGEVPKTLEDLVKLPGVGRKTANIVLSIGFDIPALAVDTHVKRVAFRIGLTTEKDPDKVEAELTELLPPKKWSLVTFLFIMHGRNLCKARRPDCMKCPITTLCDYYKDIASKKTTP